jgi:hypothetical protein
MAFRSWNRGLAATTVPNGIGSNAYGVWLYNGRTWFPDPTFPGSSVCPGNTIVWAGKLDYWLIGSAGQPTTTLCYFDGTELVWDPLTLPTATLDHLPVGTVVPVGVTSGTCLSYDNCWFLGTDGIRVHWDGQELSDESNGLGAETWLEGNFTSAASTSSASGTPIGIAVNSAVYAAQPTVVDPDPGSPPLPPDPFGSPAPQVFGLTGGAWSPLATPPTLSGGEDLVATAMDASGDTWVAGEPPINSSVTAPAPLTRIDPDGSEQYCSGYGSDGYGAGLFSYQNGGSSGYLWNSLGVAPDASLFAGGSYSFQDPGFERFYTAITTNSQSVIVRVVCPLSPTVSSAPTVEQWEFLRPDPTYADQATAPLVPADETAGITAVSASATNDAWAAAGPGQWQYCLNGNCNGNASSTGVLAPQFYQFTDGQTPLAPAGNDDETRPSLFTLSPPVYEVSSPTVVVPPTVTKTVKKKRPPKHVKLAAAVYALHTKLSQSAGGAYSLHLIFKVRRPVTLGLAVLHDKRVVARTPLKRFRKGTGELTVQISRSAWPTGLKLLSPPASKTTSH